MLIALTGLKRTGKDTVGDILRARYGFEKARPFAVFKTALAEWFDFTPEQVDGEFKETVDHRWGFSPRQVFQIFGSELMKDDLSRHLPLFGETVGEDIWAKVWSIWYGKQVKGRDYVVCDLRFPEEREAVKMFPSSFVVRVVTDLSLPPRTDTHVSESRMDDVRHDYRLFNPMEMKGLVSAVDAMMEVLR
jgi:hypothetical protein